MGYAKYVGRVGALALALGIGTAVASPALAETPNTEAESSSAGTEPSTEQPDSDPRAITGGSTQQPGDNESDAGTHQEVTEEPHDLDDDLAEEIERELEAPEEPAVDEAVEPEPASQDEPSSSDEAVVATEPEAITEEPEAAPVEAEAEPVDESEPVASTVRSSDLPETRTTSNARTYAHPTNPPPGVPAPAPLVQQPKTPIGLILGGPVAFLDIAAQAVTMLFNPGPSVPGDPPLLLGVLAFVRREIQRTFFNSSPDAVADIASTSEGVPTRITVLSNDIDPNIGDILTITDYTQTANGAVTLNADGTFTYTPKGGFRGTDTFTYTISDDASPWHSHGLASLLTGHDSTATVTITVNTSNQRPSPDPDSVTTAEDTPVVINVLGNDKDPDGDTLTVIGVGTPGQVNPGGPDLSTRVIAMNSDGTITYTPAKNFHGVDTFKYTVYDGAATAVETVTVTVTPVNDPPVTAADSIAMPSGVNAVTVEVLGNDHDVDGDILVLTAVTGAAHGTATISDRGVTYTRGSSLATTEVLTYTVSDGTTTNTGTLTIVVPAAVNTGPEVGTPAYSYNVDRASGKVTGSVYASDPDSDPLRYELATPVDPAVGSVQIDDQTGSWSFAPTRASQLSSWTAKGPDHVEFTIVVTDGSSRTGVTVSAPITAAASFAANVEAALGGDQQSWGNQGLAIAPDGRFYFTTYLSDENLGEVVVLNPDGTYSTTIDLSSAAPSRFLSAYDVVVGANGKVYVSGELAESAEQFSDETGSGVVFVIDPDNGYTASVFSQIAEPASGLAIDDAGHVYVTSWNSDTVTVFNTDGSLNRTIASALITPGDDSGVAGLTVTADGHIYLTKTALGVVKVVSSQGQLLDTLETGGQPWSIAVGGNGLAYITDLDSSTVTVRSASGKLINEIELGTDVRATDITIGIDGTIYVPYQSSTGSGIATVNAVPVEESAPTAIAAPIVGVPGGVENSIGPVVASGVVYQTTTYRDTTSGSPVTILSAIAADGTVTSADVAGEPVGAVTLGPNGVAYQVVSVYDDTTGAYRSGVLLLRPNGEKEFTGLFDGRPIGQLLFGSDGSAYQTVFDFDEQTGVATTSLVAITSSGSTAHSLAGQPSDAIFGEPSGPVVGPDGNLYLTTTLDSPNGPITHVGVLKQGIFTDYQMPGMAAGSIVVGADGAVYQVVGIPSGASGSGIGFTAVSSVLTPTGFSPLGQSIAGVPFGSPVVASDGTVYQTVFDLSDDGSGTTIPVISVVRLVSDGLTSVAANIPGIPMDGDARGLKLVAGTDGVIFLTFMGLDDAGSGGSTTEIRAISRDGMLYGTTLPGNAVAEAVVGPDGVAYLTTYEASTGLTYVSILSALGADVHTYLGYPGDEATAKATGVIIAPDGLAYQTVSSRDSATGNQTTTVAIFTADGASTFSTKGSSIGSIMLGSNGSAFQLVADFDVRTQSAITRVFAITDSGLSQVGDALHGYAAGSATLGADGFLYVSVGATNGAGTATTVVHRIELGDDAARSGPVNATPNGLRSVSATTSLRDVSLAAVTAAGTRLVLIDDAFLARFRAVDPTGRFAFTRLMETSLGKTVSLYSVPQDGLRTAFEQAVLFTEDGTKGFARDSQGRLTYLNPYGEDILVVYAPGAFSDNFYAAGALLARPGQKVTLPAGPDGVIAVATRAGDLNYAAIAYRDIAPVASAQTKGNIVLASAGGTVGTLGMSAVDVADRLMKIDKQRGTASDREMVQIVRVGNTTKMVVYMTGVIPPMDFPLVGLLTGGSSWLEAFQVRYFGSIPSRINTAIENAMKSAKPGEEPTEIMLVGHSKGGMIAQNYAESGKYKDKVKAVVTFGSPIIKNPTTRYLAIHLRDKDDGLINTLHDATALSSNETWMTEGRVYSTPRTTVGDKHSMENYLKIANNFEGDSKWRPVKDRMGTFRGTLVATDPKPKSIWDSIFKFA